MTREMYPLVSVIISFFNEEIFLIEAIESVLAQSYTNWEIILINDGSKDKSTLMAKEYVVQYPDKIFYIEHENHANKGLSYSRNQGVAKAKGNLVAILDADDIWLTDKLKIQVRLMTAYPKATMLCEASEYWYHPWHLNSESNEVIQIGNIRDRLFEPFELSKQLYPLSDGAAPCPSGIIIRRDVLIKHGAFEAQFTGKYQPYEDQAFLQKIYLNEYVYISSHCNNRYRQRSGSLVANLRNENDNHVVLKYFLEWLEQYLILKNIVEAEIKNLLIKALKPYRQIHKSSINRLYKRFKKSLRITNAVKR